MLVCRDESIEFTSEDRQNIGPAVGAWVSEMEKRGVRLQGDVLRAGRRDGDRFSARRRDTCRPWTAPRDGGPRVWFQSS